MLGTPIFETRCHLRSAHWIWKVANISSSPSVAICQTNVTDERKCSGYRYISCYGYSHRCFATECLNRQPDFPPWHKRNTRISSWRKNITR